MTSDVVALLLTAPDEETGRRIARALVEERLAACVNVLPGVRSIYRWKGAVEEASEVMLVAKTRASRAAALAARVRALHPYELPEVLALPVTDGSQAYLRWVVAESR
ncbi:MAG TPA: divalent-cation tolerance protein CutA [Myxococcota bacterium]|nr:divalent-cation tolerance protein CutA [Myxococcota bacterium]